MTKVKYIILKPLVTIISYIPIPRFIFFFIVSHLPRKRRLIFQNNATNLMIDNMGESQFISAMLNAMEKTFKVEVSKNYPSTEAEIEEAFNLETHPKFLPYKNYFTNTLRNLRVKNGLSPDRSWRLGKNKKSLPRVWLL